MNSGAEVRKRWTAFWLAEGAALLLGAAAFVLFPGSGWAAAGAFVVFSALWAVYYYRLEYTVLGGGLNITSGIFFRRHRLLPPENVLWEMRLSLPPFRRSAVVILHTSGGRAVIFGEYSTESLNNVENPK